VGGLTQSTSCPGCNKPVIVEDFVVTKLKHGLIHLQTCGSLTVKKRGRVMADFIEAHGGIICEGVIQAKKIVSGKHVVIGKSATFKGDLQAPSVEMKLGAKIGPSLFAVPSDPLELGDM